MSDGVKPTSPDAVRAAMRALSEDEDPRASEASNAVVSVTVMYSRLLQEAVAATKAARFRAKSAEQQNETLGGMLKDYGEQINRLEAEVESLRAKVGGA